MIIQQLTSLGDESKFKLDIDDNANIIIDRHEMITIDLGINRVVVLYSMGQWKIQCNNNITVEQMNSDHLFNK